MSKSAEAFRTIGEVADELDVPKHVLRFWEGKFPHIRPMKRGGGRRYYRPEDMELLRGIRHLLHAEGYTIKGVQKILREQGIDQVKVAAAAATAAAEGERRAAKARGRPARPAPMPDKSVTNAKPSRAAAPVVDVASLAAPCSVGLEGQVGGNGLGKSGILSTKDIIAAAIRELELCREILASGSAKASSGKASLTMRAARS